MLNKENVEIIELCLNATRTTLKRNEVENDDFNAFEKQLCIDRIEQIDRALEKVRKM